MIPFRGNKEQISILERIFKHLAGDRMWLVSKGDNQPLFNGQVDFQPLVRYHQYMIRTDDNKFIPDIYLAKFVFNEHEGLLSEIHMPREVVDWLKQQDDSEVIDKVKELEIVVEDEHTDDVPIVMPNKAEQQST